MGGIVLRVPQDLRYSDEHIWVKAEGENVLIGITEFAQSELGDIVFVELPEKGSELKADEPFGSVESVKTVSELYAPVSGKVIEINEALAERPELVNESPYDKAWLLAVQLTNADELEHLMSPEAYKKLVSDAE